MKMKKVQCFVIKRGTNFDRDIKEHFGLRDKWENVFPRVSELLGEKITEMALDTDELVISLDEIKNEQTKKLFTKNGVLRKNLKASNQLRKDYQRIIQEEGLKRYRELRFINFVYGVMRLSGQMLESFVTDEHDVYYRADFDLEKKTNGLVTPISEVEYQETYLNELKKRKE